MSRTPSKVKPEASTHSISSALFNIIFLPCALFSSLAFLFRAFINVFHVNEKRRPHTRHSLVTVRYVIRLLVNVKLSITRFLYRLSCASGPHIGQCIARIAIVFLIDSGNFDIFLIYSIVRVDLLISIIAESLRPGKFVSLYWLI